MHRTFTVLVVVSVLIAKTSVANQIVGTNGPVGNIAAIANGATVGNGSTISNVEPKYMSCMQSNGAIGISLFMMGMTPKCDKNGDLAPKQCYDYNQNCVCVTKQGQIITPPSNTLKACKCLVRKHKVMTSDMLGAFAPQCDEDGTYMKRQCHYSTGYCHCANPITGDNTTVPTRGDITCD